MAQHRQEIPSSPSDLSDSGSESDDSQYDPSFGIADDIESSLSKLSVNPSSKSRCSRQKDEKDEPNLDDIIQDGNLEKLKVEQCKVYLRKHGLRLTGNKETLIQRIKEHLAISNGDGERKYPASSFVLNCKGDACTGDVVLFEQNVYEMFSIASRSATGPPCGTRMVAGRIIKESYGTAKQQHTFTIEVLWSKGEKPLPPLHPLLIKGRNLYRLKTMRQKWEDEGKRLKMLDEKHARGFAACSNREARVNEKEMRKKTKTNRVVDTRYNSGKAGTSGHNQHQQQPAIMQNPSPECKENPSRRPEPCLKVNNCSETLHSQRQPLSSNNQPGALAGTRISQQHNTVNHPFNSGHSGSQGTMQYSTSVNENTSQNHTSFPYQRYATYHESKSSEAARSSFHGPYGSSRQHVNQAARVDKQMPNHHHRNDRFKGADHLASSKSNTNVQVCRYYPQGRCYYGDVCKYLHVKQGN